MEQRGFALVELTSLDELSFPTSSTARVKVTDPAPPASHPPGGSLTFAVHVPECE